MSWLDVVPTFLIALTLVVLPGAPVAWALGARGVAFAGISIGGSVTATAVAAIIAPWLNLPWQAWLPFLVSLPVAAIGFGLRRWWRRRFVPPEPALVRDRWPLLVTALGAVAIPAVLIGGVLVRWMVLPEHPTQTYDGVFHLNAVRLILDTGNASSLTLGLTSAEGSFYPAAWHGITALVVQLTGVPIVVAANVMTFVISCVIWPGASIFLARQLFGAQKLPILITGILAAAFVSFPLYLSAYGVLYPYLLAVALAPILLGLLVSALGLARGAGMETPGRWLALAWVVPGATLAHPSILFALIALSLPLSVQALVRHLGRVRAEGRMRTVGIATIFGFTAAYAGGALIWLNTATSDNSWLPHLTVIKAAGEAVLNVPLVRPAAFAVSALMLLGIIVALVVERHRWMVFSWLILVFLYVMVAAWPPGVLRNAFTGIWYNNTQRLAGLIPIMALPLAVLGTTALIRWAQRRVRTARTPGLDREVAGRPLRAWAAVAITALAAGILIPATQTGAVPAVEHKMAAQYRFSEKSHVLSPDEVAIFEIVARETPPDAVIAGNPWNGSALVYAYTGRPALFPHLSGEWSDEQWLLAEGFTSATAEVCEAVHSYGITHVLDFGGRKLFKNDPRAEKFPGFSSLKKSDAVTLVAEQGKAKLYRVTACGLGAPGSDE